MSKMLVITHKFAATSDLRGFGQAMYQSTACRGQNANRSVAGSETSEVFDMWVIISKDATDSNTRHYFSLRRRILRPQWRLVALEKCHYP